MVSIKQTIDSTSKLLSAYLTIYTHIDGRHLCHPSDAFNETAPVNATDLLADARVFCARSGKLLPNMRPGATIMGNGRGISSKQHFKISWVKGCRPENGTSLTPSLVDPQGNGERLGEERDDRCTWLLYQNWKKCEKETGAGGHKQVGCVDYWTGPGHPVGEKPANEPKSA